MSGWEELRAKLAKRIQQERDIPGINKLYVAGWEDAARWFDLYGAALSGSTAPLDRHLLTEAAAFMGLSEELGRILAAAKMLDAPVTFAASPDPAQGEPQEGER